LGAIFWMTPLDFYRMITSMLFPNMVLMFLFSILWLDSKILFLFQLYRRPPRRLVHWYPFRLVHYLRRLKLFQILIDLLQWTTIHPFLVYSDGIPRQLKLLDLMSVIFSLDDKIEVKRNMSSFHWWLMYLKHLILLHTQMLMDKLNGNRLCR
jgi:hypothetical protein